MVCGRVFTICGRIAAADADAAVEKRGYTRAQGRVINEHRRGKHECVCGYICSGDIYEGSSIAFQLLYTYVLVYLYTVKDATPYGKSTHREIARGLLHPQLFNSNFYCDKLI